MGEKRTKTRPAEGMCACHAVHLHTSDGKCENLSMAAEFPEDDYCRRWNSCACCIADCADVHHEESTMVLPDPSEWVHRSEN